MPEPTFLIPSHGLLNARQAAALCGVGVDTIYSWVHKQYLPVISRDGTYCRHNLYNLIDIARAEAVTRKLARRLPPTLDGWGIEGAPDADVAEIFGRFAEHADQTPVVQRSLVYYVQFGGRIKIGTSSVLRHRLSEVPHDELLATEPGDRTLEQERHSQFAELRVYREWFRPGPALMDHIASLAGLL